MKRPAIVVGCASSIALVGVPARAQMAPAPTTPALTSDGARSDATPEKTPAVSPPPPPSPPAPATSAESAVVSSEAASPASNPPFRSKSGFEFSLRTGFGLPIGAADGGTQMTDMLTHVVPLWVDLGYRPSPPIYVGIYFQHGFGSLNTGGAAEQGCTRPGLSCTTSDVRLGIDLDVHLAPDETFDPWFGLGTGLEIQTFTVNGSAATATIRTMGPEYMNLHFGANWNVTRMFAVGPFLSLSFDQFQSISSDTTTGQSIPGGSGQVADQTIHGWLLVGVRSTVTCF
jgi:hypothetical protein